MAKYISFLRGINVSGQKSITMSDLKADYEGLNFQNVETYIQSGNVIFEANDKLSTKQLSEKIEKVIYKKYKFEVPVIIRTAEEMKKIIASNPFLKESGIDIYKQYVTFLYDLPKGQTGVSLLIKGQTGASLLIKGQTGASILPKELPEKIKSNDYLPDRFEIIGREVYLSCPHGYGRTKLNNNFFENKLKVKATTRNWRTVKKLYEIANN